MNTDYYELEIGNTIIAKHLTLEYACLFTRAIFQEFYNDEELSVIIKKENEE